MAFGVCASSLNVCEPDRRNTVRFRGLRCMPRAAAPTAGDTGILRILNYGGHPATVENVANSNGEETGESSERGPGHLKSSAEAA